MAGSDRPRLRGTQRMLVAASSALLLACTAACGGPAPAQREGRTAPAAPASATPPTRVLVNGDSISQGRDGDYTWRYRLAREIQRQRAPIDLVGSQQATWAGQGRYADPAFDRDHFSRWGTQLAAQVPLVADEVRAQQPDVVVNALGIVDLSTRSPAEVEGSLRQWIAQVRSAKPDTRIVISPVLARATFVTPATVADYARRERAVARALSTTASPITVASTDRGWDLRRMTWDGTHPLCNGEIHIARAVSLALHDVGLLPGEPPDAVPGCRTPRPLEATAEVRFGSRRIAWDPVARATSYRVAYRVGSSRTWRRATVTRRVAPALRGQRITVAKVWPQNESGRGPIRIGRRP